MHEYEMQQTADRKMQGYWLSAHSGSRNNC